MRFKLFCKVLRQFTRYRVKLPLRFGYGAFIVVYICDLLFLFHFTWRLLNRLGQWGSK